MKRYYFDCKGNKDKFYLVIYDISDDRRRGKVARLLESYGVRVQMSAFELCVNKEKYHILRRELDRLKGNEDSIRLYPISYEDVVNQDFTLIEELKVDIIIV